MLVSAAGLPAVPWRSKSTCLYVNAYISTSAYVCMYVCLFVFLFVCVHRVCMVVRMHMCMQVCASMHAHMYCCLTISLYACMIACTCTWFLYVCICTGRFFCIMHEDALYAYISKLARRRLPSRTPCRREPVGQPAGRWARPEGNPALPDGLDS